MQRIEKAAGFGPALTSVVAIFFYVLLNYSQGWAMPNICLPTIKLSEKSF